MKNLPVTGTVLLAVAALLSGCVTVKDTVYLESLSVTAPVEQPPVHITMNPKEGQVTVTPRFSNMLQERYDDHSIPYTFIGDTFALGHMFHWTIPAAQFGLDLDWMITNGFALTMGLTVSSGNNASLTGGYFGIGIPFQGESMGGRLDGGIQFQQLNYDAYSVVVRNISVLFAADQQEIKYYHDISTSTPMNVYFTFTLNSRYDYPLNFFGSISFTTQNLASFSPNHVWTAIPPLLVYERTDQRADHSTSFLMATPGIIVSVSPTVHVLAGVRFMREMAFSGGESGFSAPMIQWNITF